MANKRQRFDGKFHPMLMQWLREQSIITNRSLNNIVETTLLEKSGITLAEGTFHSPKTYPLPADNQS